MTTSKAIMVQGTNSNSGKSMISAALCRIYGKAGFRVAPFKAQNMSLNSYVTRDGFEIARAQALQALAAGVEPRKEMNPILLKPKTKTASQMVILGKPFKDVEASEYYSFAEESFMVVKESFRTLREEFDLIVIEGAGSPAEINLYDKDIANMRLAEEANAPVVLVGDIELGGVFASIYGTVSLLRDAHKSLLRGFIINKFRGDKIILDPGIKELERLTSRPVFGVIPFIEDLKLPGEDSLSISNSSGENTLVTVGVIMLPQISNFTDFDPLKYENGVSVKFVSQVDGVDELDAIILPGTKNTVNDILWLKKTGLADKIVQAGARKIPVLGICGGFQMLGKTIVDEAGLEGGIGGKIGGLGLLDATTSFNGYSKVTIPVLAEIVSDSPIIKKIRLERVNGYEIHMGSTTLGSDAHRLFRIVQATGEETSKPDGAVDRDGLVLGTYIHGLFDDPNFRNCFLDFLVARKNATRVRNEWKVQETWETSLDKIASVFVENIDLEAFYEEMCLPKP